MKHGHVDDVLFVLIIVDVPGKNAWHFLGKKTTLKFHESELFSNYVVFRARVINWKCEEKIPELSRFTSTK